MFPFAFIAVNLDCLFLKFYTDIVLVVFLPFFWTHLVVFIFLAPLLSLICFLCRQNAKPPLSQWWAAALCRCVCDALACLCVSVCARASTQMRNGKVFTSIIKPASVWAHTRNVHMHTRQLNPCPPCENMASSTRAHTHTHGASRQHSHIPRYAWR